MTTNTDTERDASRLTAAIRLVLRQYWGQVRHRRAAALGRVRAAGAGRHPHLLRSPAGGRPAAGRDRPGRAPHARRARALRGHLRGAVAERPDRLAAGGCADRSRRDSGHRGAVHRSDGRAARQGSRVLPEQLRRIAHQARPRLRAALRGRVRRDVVSGGAIAVAARVRRHRAVVVLALAHRAARRHARDDARHGRAVDSPPAAAGRHPRGRVERAGRPRRRFDYQRGSRARVRARGRRGAHPRRQRGRLRREDAAIVGLPEPARRSRHRRRCSSSPTRSGSSWRSR